MSSSGNSGKQIAVIAGAGPAGITAGYELLKRTNIKPLIFEKSDHLGGISRTVEYKGNRLILFTASMPHQAQSVSRQCYELRTCVVFKTNVKKD